MCFVVLKLLKMAKSVRALLDTVVQALPEVGNLGLLFFLLFFIFAALGVELFGRVGTSSSRKKLSPHLLYLLFFIFTKRGHYVFHRFVCMFSRLSECPLDFWGKSYEWIFTNFYKVWEIFQH